MPLVRLPGRRVKRSVRRTTVTAADLREAQSQSRQRKPRSLTRAAQVRFLARAKKRGLMKCAAANAAAALPATPNKLQQIEAQVRAGLVADPLTPVMPGLDPGIHGERAGRRTASWIAGGERAFTPVFDGLCPAMTELSLTERVRALYEDGLVPVGDIARLVGVTERTLYKYAARGRWRKRYARRALAKGTGGRFVPQAEAAVAAGAAKASGLRALDPLAAGQALAACAQAEAIARRAATHTLAAHKARAAREAVLREFEIRARRLALLTRSLRWLVAAPG